MLPDEEIGKQERAILTRSDSQTLKQALAAADDVGWMNRNLWAGLVPYYGSSAMTLLGSPEELAEIFLEYKRIGVTQFIISGWPKLDEMLIFGREVLPLDQEGGTTLKEAADVRTTQTYRQVLLLTVVDSAARV